MAKSEPIKHHYIPQFILRNFVDENGYLNFFDKRKQKVEYLLPKDVFVIKDLYRDDKNNPLLPVEIEKDLSSLENQASVIIKKFMNGNEIIISKKEEQILRVFLFVMCFRSKRTKDSFVKNISEFDKSLYSQFQKDGNMESWWKRNLGALAKCRNDNDVLENNDIDPFVKCYFSLDTNGLLGSYFMIYRIKGKDKLILSDTYPLTDTYTNGLFMKLKNFYMPISPERILILVKNFFGNLPPSYLLPNEQFLIRPIEKDDKYIYKVGKQFKNFVQEFNGCCINDSVTGYILPNNVQ